MTDELNLWRDAHDVWLSSESDDETARIEAAAVIRDYGDRRDADAYQRGKLEGARLAIEAISLIIHDQDRETVAALDPAKIVGEG